MATTKTTNEEPQQPRGYGIDELRYRRAYALARYEMAKMSFVENLEAAKNQIPTAISGKGIMGKIFGSLNYLDYAIIAYRIISKFRKYRKRNED